jgi:hypothetical protein
MPEWPVLDPRALLPRHCAAEARPGRTAIVTARKEMTMLVERGISAAGAEGCPGRALRGWAAAVLIAAGLSRPVAAQSKEENPAPSAEAAEAVEEAARAAQSGGFASLPPVQGIELSPPALNLGPVPPNIRRSAVVRVRNTSDHPMTITDSRTSCSCTTIDVSNTTLPPGGEIPLTITLDGRAQTGEQRARVWLVFGADGVAHLPITADIALPVHAEPAFLGAVSASHGEITVASGDGAPFRILAVDGGVPPFIGFDPAVDPPRSSYRLRWDLSGYDARTCLNPAGRRMPGWWAIETDRADCPVVDVRIRHECTKPPPNQPRQTWVLKQQHALIGNVRSGQPVEFTIDLKWAKGYMNADTMTHVTTETDAFRAELAQIVRKPQETILTIRVTPTQATPGLLYGTIRIHSIKGFEYPLTVIGRIAD